MQALWNGVLETSIQAIAGSSSGAVVSPYARALSGELAVEEFSEADSSVMSLAN